VEKGVQVTGKVSEREDIEQSREGRREITRSVRTEGA
jgi:hypothetical protein